MRGPSLGEDGAEDEALTHRNGSQGHTHCYRAQEDGFSQGLEDGQGEEGEEGDVLHCSSLCVETVQCSADQTGFLAFYNPSSDQALSVMPASRQVDVRPL